MKTLDSIANWYYKCEANAQIDMTNLKSTKLKIISPLRSGQATEQVVARVYELIKHQDLKPGDRLPPERELAKQLGISRPSLRLGLSSLISMGVAHS